jgi:hypothetical protein
MATLPSVLGRTKNMKRLAIFQHAIHARLDVPTRRTERRPMRSPLALGGEGLEPRLVLSAPSTPAPVAMVSATQTDSRSITIDYQVNQTADPSQPLQFAVYRSNAGQFNSNATLVDEWSVSSPGEGVALLDNSGHPANAVGPHELTIALPNGLPIDPQQPYVLVVADPNSSSAATNPTQTASYRTYSIGIVTHGGLQNTHWQYGPAWEIATAVTMKRDGYDAVIPYNWMAASDLPGRAAMQGPRLASEILGIASQFPANDPVDLHFVGHSEGAVVNTQALVALEKQMTPQLKAGYIQDTLLDPHPANNAISGGEYSVTSGPLGWLATAEISSFQSKAKDPPVFIPPIVNDAEVFYEHTTADNSHGVNDNIYNLWGEVPVKGPAHYYNLTAAGATHAGNTGVNQWYADFVAPTLGNQEPLIQTLQLSGQIDQSSMTAATPLGKSPAGVNATVNSRQPEFSGTAAPGAVIRLYVGPASNPGEINAAGWTTANASGEWSLETRSPLPNGRYRAVATSFTRRLATRPALVIVPTLPLGSFVVDAGPGSA